MEFPSFNKIKKIGEPLGPESFFSSGISKVRSFYEHSYAILIMFKIMIIFNNSTSADFVLISVENDHNFEQYEDRATVILKWKGL